jgi:uncharacterized protein (DUF342 family)
MTEQRAITTCPSCLSRYRVRTHFGGRKVPCKKCGVSFVITLESRCGVPSSPPEPNGPIALEGEPNDRINEGMDPPVPDAETSPSPMAQGEEAGANWFDLQVSKDRLQAFIFPKGDPPEQGAAIMVLAHLEATGIKQGLLSETEISEMLMRQPFPKEPHKVAEGELPLAPDPAQLICHFETDPLRIGALKEGDIIDFKDRGEIPQVKAGDLIAEIMPAKEGRPGIDVFGLPILPPKPKLLKVRTGQGVEKSEDGSRFFAKIDGRPVLAPDGKLSVLPQLKIKGDVGLETGHIDFEGAVDVAGGIKKGFNVNCSSLIVREVIGAEVVSTGDVNVLGGVIGATIWCNGNLKARYIHDSRMEVSGNLVVQREIIDSRIDISGKCQVERGKILSSQISAKQGIDALEIGSETARPCALIIGVDERVEREVARVGECIARLRAQKSELENEVARLNAKSARLNKQLGDLAQVQDRAIVEQRNLKERMAALAGGDGGPEEEEMRQQLHNLESNIAELEVAVGRLLDSYEAVSLEVEKGQKGIQETEEKIKTFTEDLAATTAWSKEVKGTPVLTVRGKIFAGTSVKGPFASMVFKEDLSHITIKEMKGLSSDPTPQWKIVK